MTDVITHATTFWAKYNAYEIKTADDGVRYVTPCTDAEVNPFNPLPVSEKMVLDAINTGLVSMRRDKKGMENAVLRFVNEYGLLGLMPGIPTTPQFIDYENVYLLKNPYIKQEFMDTMEYMDYFYPFEKPEFQKSGLDSLWNITNDFRMGGLAVMLGHLPQAQLMSFLRIYAERFDWIEESFREIAFQAVTCHYYYNEPEYTDSDERRLYQKAIMAYDAIAPTYHIELRERPILTWDFSSLLQIIHYSMAFAIADDHSTIRMCDQCGNAYISKGKDDIFCSEECREKFNRKKKK